MIINMPTDNHTEWTYSPCISILYVPSLTHSDNTHPHLSVHHRRQENEGLLSISTPPVFKCHFTEKPAKVQQVLPYQDDEAHPLRWTHLVIMESEAAEAHQGGEEGSREVDGLSGATSPGLRRSVSLNFTKDDWEIKVDPWMIQFHNSLETRKLLIISRSFEKCAFHIVFVFCLVCIWQY